MKKLITAVLAFSLVGMLFTGCSESENKTTADTQDTALQETVTEGGKIKLRVWSEAANFDTLNKMIDSFKQEYAGQAEFEITLEEASDAETKNNVLADVHHAADVFPMADDQLSGMVAAGALYPVPNADEIKNANLKDSVDAASINDTLYAYPMTADNGYFMYYNKEYFSESDVQTLDGMLKIAEKNNKKITMDWTSGWYLYAFFGNTGLDFGVNDDGVTNYCDWNSTEGDVKGTYIAEALLQISASSGFMNAEDTAFIDGARNGNVIAGISGVWNAVEIQKIWGENMGAVKLPTYTLHGKQVQMSSFKGYKLMGVNAYSEYPQWAAKLADWLTNEENQMLRFEERGQGPSNVRAAESDTVGQAPAIQAVIAQSEFGKLQRVGNSYWNSCSQFGETMAAGNPSNVALQDIMDTLVAGITQSVAQ